MDIRHLKYALEVERYGSISKTAERLYVSQPFLSKLIRDLEDDLGFDIFNRSSRGVEPTKKGKEFLMRARAVTTGFDDLESAYQTSRREELSFDITVPIACYVSHAFVDFIAELGAREKLRVDYRETNTISAIERVAAQESTIGIIRYQTQYEDYFLRYAEGKDLVVRPLWEFDYHLIVSKLSPLARKELVEFSDLEELIEISHGDPEVPALPVSIMQEHRRRDSARREIVVYERQSQFELLCEIPQTYMWASPTPESIFATHPLIQIKCSLPGISSCKDALIYRRGYSLTQEDRLFVRKVKEVIQTLKR